MNNLHYAFAAMILLIKFSGGMGISYQGSVDLSALPDRLSEEVRTVLSEENLSRISSGERNQHAVDTVLYEFQYVNSGKRFRIDESQVNDEFLDLVDDLKDYLNYEQK